MTDRLSDEHVRQIGDFAEKASVDCSIESVAWTHFGDAIRPIPKDIAAICTELLERRAKDPKCNPCKITWEAFGPSNSIGTCENCGQRNYR